LPLQTTDPTPHGDRCSPVTAKSLHLEACLLRGSSAPCLPARQPATTSRSRDGSRRHPPVVPLSPVTALGPLGRKSSRCRARSTTLAAPTSSASIAPPAPGGPIASAESHTSSPKTAARISAPAPSRPPVAEPCLPSSVCRSAAYVGHQPSGCKHASPVAPDSSQI